MAAPRTLMDYLGLAAGHLKASGIESHRLDAEVLLADILGVDRIQLYVQHDRPLNKDEIDAVPPEHCSQSPEGTRRCISRDARVLLHRL